MVKGWLTLAALAVGAVALASRRDSSSPVPGGAPPLEDYAPHELATHCDPTPKLGAVILRAIILQSFGGGDLGIRRECHIGALSEHHEGRAFDWGVIEGATLPGTIYTPADVDGFFAWLLAPDAWGRPHANARRAGVMYVIYDRRIWRSYDMPGEPRGEWYAFDGEDPHTTHAHLSLSRAGGAGETSLYGGSSGRET